MRGKNKENKNDITCNERGTFENVVEDYFEITADGKVWPCCMYISMYLRMNEPGQEAYKEALFEDPVFKELSDQDENWNSIHHYNLDSIISNRFFTEHNNNTGWDSDSPPFACTLFCKKGSSGMKGYMRRKMELKNSKS